MGVLDGLHGVGRDEHPLNGHVPRRRSRFEDVDGPQRQRGRARLAVLASSQRDGPPPNLQGRVPLVARRVSAARFHGLLRTARRQPHRPKHRRGLQREHIFHAPLGCRLALAIRPNDVAEVGVMQGGEHIVVIRFLVQLPVAA